MKSRNGLQPTGWLAWSSWHRTREHRQGREADWDNCSASSRREGSMACAT